MKPLLGKVALVTGASRGVGKGIALSLGEAGATVYITGRTIKEGKSAACLLGTLYLTFRTPFKNKSAGMHHPNNQ
jgi:NAD(P)-dependent dehydrogenase (short-subunit alcohol dehydrogenase family)